MEVNEGMSREMPRRDEFWMLRGMFDVFAYTPFLAVPRKEDCRGVEF